MPLSFTLYLPPDYKPGTRLPTMLWAYPLDYADKAVAGQVEGSADQFTTIQGTSPLFFLLRGYAVLQNVAMPVVGPPRTVYDTFVEQIVANAKAAIDKGVELGVVDPERVGVAGHSHGALMTANLLAHSDLFRAGIARSGAYNHTTRPFGFQNEKRTLWEAREVYTRLSPVIQADKIDEPLLLIHGEVDVNPGTVPLQSEKLFEALRGVGGHRAPGDAAPREPRLQRARVDRARGARDALLVRPPREGRRPPQAQRRSPPATRPAVAVSDHRRRRR